MHYIILRRIALEEDRLIEIYTKFFFQLRVCLNHSSNFFFNQNHKICFLLQAHFQYLSEAFNPNNGGVIRFRVSFVKITIFILYSTFMNNYYL